MNRRERRKMSRNLGILEYQRNLPFDKKMQNMRENIRIGKQMQLGNVEQVRQQTNSELEKKDSDVVNNIINEIINKGSKDSINDIVEEAKSEAEKRSIGEQ